MDCSETSGSNKFWARASLWLALSRRHCHNQEGLGLYSPALLALHCVQVADKQAPRLA